MRFFIAVILFYSLSSFGQISVERNQFRTHGPAGLGPIGRQLTYRPQLQLEQTPSADEVMLKPVLEKGKRAIEWLNLVNSQRDPAQRLNIADKTTSNPVPPEKPKIVSVQNILEKFNKSKTELPVTMTQVIFENRELTSTVPSTDEEFIKHIREINKSYQSAIRWVGQIEYFDYYEQASFFDVRGYYFLMKEKDLTGQLVGFSKLPAEKKTQFKGWLIGLCHNSQIQRHLCEDELNIRIKQNNVLRFFNKYHARAKKNYDEFFELQPYRKELTWNTQKSVLTQDFILPGIAQVAQWLKSNVEEEWTASGFQLLLRFIPQNDTAPYIAFEKGVTPHVTGPTANKIVMDPDYSLDDYDTQWTIRHEFGHVLGFPDCYLEFYDSKTKEMTYYTIEPDNLMCAWGGKLKPTHVHELRRVYW